MGNATWRLEPTLPPAAHAVPRSTRNPQLVRLGKLDTVSLKRYRRVFCLDGEVDLAAAKEALLSAVERHFSSQEVDEAPVLLQFAASARKRYRRKQLLAAQWPHAGALGDDADADGGACGGYWQRTSGGRHGLLK